MRVGEKCRCAGCMKEINDDKLVCSCGYANETAENPAHCLQIGAILAGEYAIGRVIGEGGFGITYVGWDMDLDKKVAIKEFYMDGFTSRNATVSSEVISKIGEDEDLFEVHREKFVNEAKVLASFMDEPGIVTVYRFFKENNTAYIVMEYVEGTTLKEFLKQKGKMTVDETIGIIGPVMNSLAKVHEKNLVHRDISPDNIMITANGRGKLIDFGAAREANGGNKSLSVVLKHGYAPMEQYQTRGNQGPWTDVYALSATIYRCITGKVPAESTDRVLDDALEEVCALEPSCSKAVSDVISKGLSIRVKDRYQSVGELKAALMSALNGENGNASSEQALYQQSGQVPYQQMGQVPYQQMGQVPYQQMSQVPYQQAGNMTGTGMPNANQGYGNMPQNVQPQQSAHAQQSQQPTPAQQSNSVQPQSAKSEKKSKKGLFIALAAVVAIVMVIIGSIFIGSSRKSSEPAEVKQEVAEVSVEDTVFGTDNKTATDTMAVDSSEETSTPLAGSGKVGISMPTRDLQRWNLDGANMQKELEAGGYTVDLQYASNDVQTQISQIENMISDGCDVLIIAAIEGTSLQAVVDKAKANDIPVISYDRLLMYSDGVSYYATFDNYAVGTVQGKYVESALGLDSGKGPFNIEFTAGDSEDYNADYFFQGAYDVLKPYIDNGQLKVLSGETTFKEVATEWWATENAQARAEKIISSFYSGTNDIDVWLCSNDSTALGVANALSSSYNGSYPIITGQDCDIAAVKNILAGKQSMSIFKDTRTLASQTVKMATQIINGETVDVNDTTRYNNGSIDVKAFLCEPVYADAGNYKVVLIESGYYTEGQLR